MKLLTRDAILAAPDLKEEELEVPEWGGAVMVRALTGAERDSFEESCMKGSGKKRKMNFVNFRAKLVARTVVDDKGKRVFTRADIAALGQKSAAALERIFDLAMQLSGMTEEDVEELAGNSEDGQSDDSTSGSLWPSE